MEHDVVLADEVHHLGVAVFPILLPVGCKVLGSRYIAYRSVEPHVEHLTLGALHGHGNAPIEVAAHGAGLEAQIEPALALPVNVAFPLLVALQNPSAEESLVFVQRQIPVLRFAFYGHRARHRAAGLYELVGRKGRSALLALVAVRAVVAAAGARADNVAIGEERSRLLVVILHRGALDELALVVELAEKVRSRNAVRGRRGARIYVERDAQTAERILDYLVVTVDHRLRRHALLAGLDGDGHAVLVAAAHRHHVAAAHAQVTRVDVRRNVNARQMAYMHGTVGIGQSRSNEVSFELFCHKQI